MSKKKPVVIRLHKKLGFYTRTCRCRMSAFFYQEIGLREVSNE